MPHIALTTQAPGIRGLLAFRPETAAPLSELAEVLLRGPSTLGRGERELIATYVSELGSCRYCAMSHAALAAAQLPGGMEVVDQVRTGDPHAAVSPKLRALLSIAAAVQESGKAVTPAHVAAARDAGATSLEIHDTVLIAAAFCMYNRYVDGLATGLPEDEGTYESDARRIVAHGYATDLHVESSPGTADGS